MEEMICRSCMLVLSDPHMTKIVLLAPESEIAKGSQRVQRGIRGGDQTYRTQRN